jgi:hypothetical protein
VCKFLFTRKADTLKEKLNGTIKELFANIWKTCIANICDLINLGSFKSADFCSRDKIPDGMLHVNCFSIAGLKQRNGTRAINKSRLAVYSSRIILDKKDIDNVLFSLDYWILVCIKKIR